MADRRIAHHSDGNEGMHSRVIVERSAAGSPGIVIVAERWDGDLKHDEICVVVEDGASFLAPVNEWLSR